MRRTVIVDTETTGLTPSWHMAWEIAVIDRATGAEHAWRVRPLPADLDRADPAALTIGRFAEQDRDMRIPMWSDGELHDLAPRIAAGEKGGLWSSREAVAEACESLLSDAILVAANPAFDAGFLSALLASQRRPPQPWHYRLRDIGSMAWGYLCGVATVPPPIDASTDVMAEALGVDVGRFERHSALGDCRLVNAMMQVIEGAKL